MRFRLSHRTSYVYASPVDLAQHVLRLDARPLPTQRIDKVVVVCSPRPSRVSQTVDHFGNRITHVALAGPHDRLDLTLEASGEILPRTPPPPDATMPWEEVAAALLGDGFPTAVEASEFVHASPRAAPLASFSPFAQASFAGGRPILEAVLELTHRIHEAYRYDPAATDVSTPLAEVVARRAGVCQDFAHLQIAGLRALGLAARYVSGYIATRPVGAARPLRGADASHAWVSVWCGPRAGWIDVDPTNDLLVSDAHVVAAWGRDYGDVSPVRGVFVGGGAHSLSVAVDLEQLGPSPPAAAQD
ncbi:MAG: transglutaminase family protein [Alphaproteobacteria bacterium]|nr:transglutaminase family protein [Alphaproteobacteria bacterium]